MATKKITTMSSNYMPLPVGVTIGKSKIHGLGLIATQPILSDTMLGVSHYRLPDGRIIRTPIGGFGNHSLYPNCAKTFDDVANCWYVFTIEDVEVGDELTWTYTLYTP